MMRAAWMTCGLLQVGRHEMSKSDGLQASLIPVLVTGIQLSRVCAAEGLLQPKDLGWLDSCDKHRNEGMRIGWNIETVASRTVDCASSSGRSI
ncbi:hypothetical protein CTT39_09085 [Agrobacterium rosae]|nr:hypothetical protein CTT39_09085 [Agrobacterium rosae]